MRRARWRLRQRMASRWVLPFGLLAGDVVLGLGVAAGTRDGHAMDRGVDLAVAAAVEAVSVGAARAGGGGGDVGGPGGGWGRGGGARARGLPPGPFGRRPAPQ